MRSVLLTAGAVLGAVCLTATAACLVLGLRPMVVISGSMSPAIPTGSLALAHSVDANDIVVGDVVSVLAGNGKRVTHRVSHIERSRDSAVLTLKGDANATPDANPYLVHKADRVVADVPWVGYGIDWLRSPIGLIGLGAAGCGLLAFALRRSPPVTGGKRRAVAAMALPVSVVLLVNGSTSTSAMFTDTGTVTSGSLSTHTVVAPASATCTSALLSGTVSWPADVRYDYEVVLRRVSNLVVVSTTQVTGATSSITYTGLLSFGLAVGAGTVDFRVEITPYLATATSWRSTTTRTYSSLRVLAIVVGATVSCTT